MEAHLNGLILRHDVRQSKLSRITSLMNNKVCAHRDDDVDEIVEARSG